MPLDDFYHRWLHVEGYRRQPQTPNAPSDDLLDTQPAVAPDPASDEPDAPFVNRLYDHIVIHNTAQDLSDVRAEQAAPVEAVPEEIHDRAQGLVNVRARIAPNSYHILECSPDGDYALLKDIRPQYRNRSFVVKNFFRRTTNRYRSYSTARAHFRALWTIYEVCQSQREDSQGLVGTFFRERSHRVYINVYEHPFGVERYRVILHVPNGSNRYYYTLQTAIPDLDRLLRTSGGYFPRRTSAEVFDAKNRVDWNAAFHYNRHRGSAPHVRCFLGIYIHHGEVQKRPLKTNNPIDAAFKFQRWLEVNAPVVTGREIIEATSEGWIRYDLNGRGAENAGPLFA